MKLLPLLLLAAFSLPETSSAEEPDGVKSVKDISAWIKEFDRVEAVVYDPSPEKPGEHPVIDGKLSKGVAKAWTKRLTEEQTEALISSITGRREPPLGGYACFLPHHGFVFYDKDSKIVGCLSICFICGTYKPSPPEGLSHPWDLERLKKLTTELGLPMFQNTNEAAAFFSDKEKLERGPEAKQNGK